MKLSLVHIGAKARAGHSVDALAREYLQRCRSFLHCEVQTFRNEGALLEWLGRQSGRVGPFLLLLDGRGKQMTSDELAVWIGRQREGGVQHLVVAVGPAEGWSDVARSEAKRRGLLLSLGPMTFAHSLARLMIAEQIYRAVTILTGHPYHKG
jgi:23S rRNA (pseudouridine1915-N3)-methyltransferase